MIILEPSSPQAFFSTTITERWGKFAKTKLWYYNNGLKYCILVYILYRKERTNEWLGGEGWFWGLYSLSMLVVHEIQWLISEFLCLVRDFLMESDSWYIFKGKWVAAGHIGCNTITAEEMLSGTGYGHNNVSVDIIVFLEGGNSYLAERHMASFLRKIMDSCLRSPSAETRNGVKCFLWDSHGRIYVSSFTSNVPPAMCQGSYWGSI